MKESRADKNRANLANAIPINTPYVVGFWTGDICNFKTPDERLLVITNYSQNDELGYIYSSS